MRGLLSEGRAPRVIVLENVYGALRSHGGKDFAAIGGALSGAGYRFGAIVIDAIRFVPQSRPRVFFIAVAHGVRLQPRLQTRESNPAWHPKALVEAYTGLSATARKKWIWWKLAMPQSAVPTLAEMIEEPPTGVRWHSLAETTHLLKMMTPVNKAKVDAAKQTGRRMVGGVYWRTRPDENGVRKQRAEIRFDGVAGCLRTPAGGSSRQTIVVVEGELVRSRLLSPREAARLMGLPDSYKMPSRYNDAYHVAGDGVCPLVVRYVAEHLLEPLVTERLPLLRLMAAA